ncbi:Na+/H+ antiporter subunit G [Pseudomonas typographi]|uniref:Na+/H+ antiporter subunit G n=1 Tax=Pseudomonas typographi TaxID=2715964 RepID=A0ABR7Z6T8_9PSED|nr:Na+/H+ antiporter subunit G [Pseudomonas typographi]MBD1554029.1 Na+/H+ antiporter subunit G [Pseudomonas typographi]MBD1589226.1 Na+/H+ antiporter subunit G [Pseudomonas typographi]MBD1601255.1 Na+/H+ antiporter subunit G [Pseudomonas typographi]
MNAIPLWVETVIATLVILSSVFALAGAIGLLRFRDFFQRMHAPALGTTLGTWLAATASVVFFSAQAGMPQLQSWLVPVLLSITAPVTTLLLARTALFRKRSTATPIDPVKAKR